MTPPDQLRFGLLLNGLYMQRWQVKCVETLLEDSRISLQLIVLPEVTEAVATPKTRRWNQYALYNMYRRFFHRLASQTEESPEWLNQVSILHCGIKQKGHSQYFHDADVERIKSHRLDFVLRFGFNIIRGDILRAARFGIWSFHHGDEQLYRGGPPAFWELLHGRTDCGAILQKLTGKLDGGIVLKKGHFAISAHSLAETHNALLNNTSVWPYQVAVDILNGTIDPVGLQPVSTNAPVYRMPKNGTMLRFFYRLMINKIRFHVRELFCPEQWNMGIVNQPLEEVLEKGIDKVRWFPEQPARKFRADPFGFVVGEEEFLLFEDYDYSTRKGKISGADVAGKMLRIFPATEHHLSYPFVFEYEGKTYCLPESFESNALRLYQWNAAQKQFEFHQTLLDGVQMTDPTLQEIDGRWWLFCTPKAHSNLALWIYHATSPFGPFEPHANNPVKWDVRGARPAGNLFQHKGQWYRPAQDCSKSYGSRIVIHRIEELSALTFRETPVKHLEPVLPYDDGLHTLSRWGNRTLIDGKRYRFNWPNFVFQIRRKLGLK